jgi:hypothetical protein
MVLVGATWAPSCCEEGFMTVVGPDGSCGVGSACGACMLASLQASMEGLLLHRGVGSLRWPQSVHAALGIEWSLIPCTKPGRCC